MNKFVILALAGAISSGYAVADNDPAAYKSMKDKASADYKAARAQCSSLKGNAKDICQEEAKVTRAKAEADAVVQHKSDAKEIRKAREDVADAEYELAKEKCDDMTGNAKSACKHDAKAAKDTAIADARRADPTPTVAERTAAATDMARDRTAATTSTAADTTRGATAAAGDAVSDTVITTKVKADLAADPGVKAMDVHVETVKGVVMLSGFVPSKAEADKAVQLARGVRGVTEVKSSIQVKP